MLYEFKLSQNAVLLITMELPDGVVEPHHKHNPIVIIMISQSNGTNSNTGKYTTH